MVQKVLMSPTRTTVVVAMLCAVVLVAGFMVGRAAAAQPHMEAALDHLRAAKAQLEEAEHDKGGHRVKAIELVNEAISEVRLGMGYAARH
ncbi:MAG TPA: hypothetical protein VMT19_08710 [Thermoanaerobaculaceae bacterium]|nr:hypothetical protein [Thermoanaerobaculaceae bacterium]